MIDLDLLRQSPFYQRKLDGGQVPFTTKAELVADQAANPPYGSNLTRPIQEYTRLHQTSGTTTGQPLRWLDTPRSWNWILDRWDIIYRHAGLQAHDRLYFAFSFGPFLGFWSAFESAHRSNHFCLTGGGMSSVARLRQIVDHGITVVLCTPTYALHLADAAAKEGIELPGSAVQMLIVAGEPGGLIAETRRRIESGWGATVVDHYGLTEVGPAAVEPESRRGGMLIIDGYEAEVIDPSTCQPTPPGEVGELVLTNVGRLDSPLARYRTGDLVRATTTPAGLWLQGGILGRTDDMIHIRGNNVYPAALEAVIRRFPEVAEFRVEVDDTAAMVEVMITIEPTAGADSSNLAGAIQQAVRDELQFRPTVIAVEPDALPRFEMKARRFVRKR